MTKPKCTLRLTGRDLNLFADLFRISPMLRGQIHRLHFREAALRRVNRRLTALVRAGYLTHEPLPLGPVSRMASGDSLSGGGQFLYRLTPATAALVATHCKTDIAEVRRRIRLGTPGFLAHAIECAEIATLLLAPPDYAGFAGLTCLEYRGEIEATHAYDYREAGGTWRTEVFKPDGYALLQAGRHTEHIFCEIDLGHASAEQWRGKLFSIRRYQSTGAFQKRYAAPGFTLWVLTTGIVRAEHLLSLAKEQGVDNVLVATLLDFAQRGPLAPIWHGTDRTSPMAMFGKEAK